MSDHELKLGRPVPTHESVEQITKKGVIFAESYYQRFGNFLHKHPCEIMMEKMKLKLVYLDWIRMQDLVDELRLKFSFIDEEENKTDNPTYPFRGILIAWESNHKLRNAVEAYLKTAEQAYPEDKKNIYKGIMILLPDLSSRATRFTAIVELGNWIIGRKLNQRPIGDGFIAGDGMDHRQADGEAVQFAIAAIYHSVFMQHGSKNEAFLKDLFDILPSNIFSIFFNDKYNIDGLVA